MVRRVDPRYTHTCEHTHIGCHVFHDVQLIDDFKWISLNFIRNRDNSFSVKGFTIVYAHSFSIFASLAIIRFDFLD